MDLSKMGSELLDENKQPISENQNVESFQTSAVPPAAEMGQKGVEGFTSTTDKKESEWQKEKACLQESLRRLEEKTKDFTKAKSKILEERELVISQDKVLEGMQIKIKHLHKQLKHPELIGSPERKEVDNCPSSLTQKIAMVKLTQKSMTDYLKKFRFYLGLLKSDLSILRDYVVILVQTESFDKDREIVVISGKKLPTDFLIFSKTLKLSTISDPYPAQVTFTCKMRCLENKDKAIQLEENSRTKTIIVPQSYRDNIWDPEELHCQVDSAVCSEGSTFSPWPGGQDLFTEAIAINKACFPGPQHPAKAATDSNCLCCIGHSRGWIASPVQKLL
ncbi:hypothetical protein BTVI_17789 [Pitangus sulphuratus]|nr:hypothetical protein BTVI_17789 [Pitangus sulphuratus]